jgi:hypothetical protein
MFRWASLLFGILAVVMACWGAYLWLISSPDGPVFVIEAPDRRLGKCPVGRSVLTFRITNQSEQPSEVLGLAEG